MPCQYIKYLRTSLIIVRITRTHIFYTYYIMDNILYELWDDIDNNVEYQKELYFTKVHLVYKGHFKDLNKWKLYCQKHFNNDGEFKEFQSANEISDKEHPYKHNHTGLRYPKQKHVYDANFFNVGDKHPHLKIINYEKQWVYLKIYISGWKHIKGTKGKYNYIKPVDFLGEELTPYDSKNIHYQDIKDLSLEDFKKKK